MSELTKCCNGYLEVRDDKDGKGAYAVCAICKEVPPEPKIITENAKIVKTFLGYEDRGIFTYLLNLQFANGGQGFGFYKLGENYTSLHIEGILKALELDSWEQLPGQLVRIRHENFGKIHAIGHYLKDKWFSPEALNEKNKEL